MSTDLMEMAMRTLALDTTYLELVLILPRDQLKQRNALQEIGLPSTGPDISRMAEKSPTLEENQEVSQKLSHSVQAKYSTAGILSLPNYTREIKHISPAHRTMPMVELIPKLLLVVNQFHSIQILTLISKFLIAIEFQTSPNKLLSQLPLPCNQEDACTFTQLLQREKEPLLF